MAGPRPRPTSGRRTGARSPAPAPRRTPRPGWRRRRRTVHGNSPAPAVRRSRADVPGDDAGAPRCDVDDDAAVRRDQLASALEQGHRVAADPDVAVGEQGGLPPALARHRVEDAAAQGRDAAGAGLPDRLRHDVDAEHCVAGQGEGLGHPAGAAADVDRRTLAVREQGEVGRAGAGEPGMRRERLRGQVALPHGAGMPLQRVRVDAGQRKRGHAVTVRQAPGGSGLRSESRRPVPPRRRCRHR